MPTPNQLSTQNFDNNLLLNALNKPDRLKRVWDISGGYNTLTMLIDQLSGSKSRRVYGMDGKFEKYIIGRNNVIQPILNNVLNANGTLTVNFTDPTYNLFRIGRTVLDSNNFEGRTVQVGAGFVVIQPLANPAVFVAATHFPAGSFIKDGWDSSINQGSTGSTSLYEYPAPIFNYTAVTRGNADWFRRNESSTWVEIAGKYWYSSIDLMAARQFAKQEEFRAREGVRSQTTSLLGGVVNQSGGIYWAIKDMGNEGRGGVVKPMSNNPAKADLEDFIMEIAARSTSPNTELIGLVGQGAMANIQTNMTQNFIQYAGELNTFGGKTVKGIDVRIYSIAGVTLKLILDPYVSDRERFPELSTIPGVTGTKRGNDILILDEGSFPVVGGGSAPAIERCYFGEQDIVYGYMNGIGMQGGGMPLTMNGMTFKQIVSNRDSVEFMCYSDSCPADAVATNMGYLFLTN